MTRRMHVHDTREWFCLRRHLLSAMLADHVHQMGSISSGAGQASSAESSLARVDSPAALVWAETAAAGKLPPARVSCASSGVPSAALPRLPPPLPKRTA